VKAAGDERLKTAVSTNTQRQYDGRVSRMAELPDPEGFAAASQTATPDDVGEKISCGPSADKHLQAIEKFVKAGFDHIVLTQIGPQEDAFFDFFQRELKPALAAKRAA